MENQKQTKNKTKFIEKNKLNSAKFPFVICFGRFEWAAYFFIGFFKYVSTFFNEFPLISFLDTQLKSIDSFFTFSDRFVRNRENCIFYLFTDVDDVKYVINFDYPSSSEDYIHRIGRTGRRRQTGTAYAFFTTHNMKHANDLIEVLREAGQTINPRLSEMAELAKSGNFAGRSKELCIFIRIRCAEQKPCKSRTFVSQKIPNKFDA